MTGKGRREVLFEMVRVGGYVKVSALDPETLTEVCIVGSPYTRPEVLRATAMRKLEYVLAKKRGSSDP